MAHEATYHRDAPAPGMSLVHTRPSAKIGPPAPSGLRTRRCRGVRRALRSRVAARRLRRSNIRIWHTRIAKPDPFSPAQRPKINRRPIASEKRGRGSRRWQTGHPRWLNDVLVRNRDPMWRARTADHPSTFPVHVSLRPAILPQTSKHGSYLQWCFLTKMLNCVLQIGQYVTSASGCHLGSCST